MDGWEKHSTLRLWYESLRPLTVDLIGDFAGRELFAIHGDALLLYCISQAKVDFQDGFQLLHAIHAVETFLANLSDRGCNFHILWFEDHQNLCIPTNASPAAAACVRLTRAVLIKHMQLHPLASKISFTFAAVETPQFRQYKTEHAHRFFLCLDGFTFDAEASPLALQHLAFIHNSSADGYSVALINGFEFKSSKALALIIPPSPGLTQISVDKLPLPVNAATTFADLLIHETKLHHNLFWDDHSPFSMREAVAFGGVCGTLLMDTEDAKTTCATAFILHLMELGQSTLSQRPCPTVVLDSDEQKTLDRFLVVFAGICIRIIETLPLHNVPDLFDLVDGRVLRYTFKNLRIMSISPTVARDASDFMRRVYALAGHDLSAYLPPTASQALASVAPKSQPVKWRPSVMAFEHEVLDEYLSSVHVFSSDSGESMGMSKIFQELSHWHNAKRSIDPKQVARPRGFFAHKRHQKLMADIIKYAESLTNGSGGMMSAETIVASPALAVPVVEASGRALAHSGRQRQGGKGAGPSGRQKALEASKMLQTKKSNSKGQTCIASWDKTCTELHTENNIRSRLAKATKHFQELSEMVLFAKMYETLVASSKLGHSNASLALFQDFTQVLGIPISATLSSDPLLASRRLPFTSELLSLSTKLQLPAAPTDFQLEWCGPFLERSVDAAPDTRVHGFEPDAWQRNVLDAIDADKSLFVVAPTSAGKTFISFYAMKKVLKSNDDVILVYVAPTKALVNQVAAEVQARFSKQYKHAARSVWAIHTRDYRINDPTGCQVLVTVPHILQIMLLAPSNAATTNSWSSRVKRIIFDEIHCIGQAEDGVIWEQLLLLAPCPIIALSATVGNPIEFKQWLETSERAKGHDLEVIIHSSRYSDLRKFLYVPPKKAVDFTGLVKPQCFPTPGLDEAGDGSEAFLLIHPVSSLTNRNRGTLDDITLEPRDCLSLWLSMSKHQTLQYPVDAALNPSTALPALVKRTDVVQWATQLKSVLHTWMKDAESPFSTVQTELGISDALMSLSKDLTQKVAGATALDSFHDKVPINKGKLELTALPLLMDLHNRRGLPAILFNYDRSQCEKTLHAVVSQLERAEVVWKGASPQWIKKLSEYNTWQKQDAAQKARAEKLQTKPSKSRSQDDDASSNIDRMRQGSAEPSKWASFDPDAPLEMFSFADHTKLSNSELDDFISTLNDDKVDARLVAALRRGVAVHHAGLNRQYRQVVEILFRKSFLRVVVATGTLALGINMPCKTVVFFGDAVFLTALNYHQGSGRAGRRGFDLLGNVVFVGMPLERVHEIMSSRLPDLVGHFPLSTTLTLRMMGLLHHTKNSAYSVRAMRSILSQSRLYLGGPSHQMAIQHNLRFSIEYLRRQGLMAKDGAPLNFAGMIGHLYFTENAVFAFHSLLKEGYLHKICEPIHRNPEKVLLDLMLVLSHLFCRIPLRSRHYMEEGFRSPSVVRLPALPKEAESILRDHNQETLGIFRLYVSTYIEQHLSKTPDTKLPFTGYEIQPRHHVADSDLIVAHLPETRLRSAFAALSGFTDDFTSIHELCATVRSGVFLDESAVPYIRIYPTDTETPWNAYVYDFFKHGDMKALVRDNLVKRGDVWFYLKDFSLVVATIVTSLENYIAPNAAKDDDFVMDIDPQDLQDSDKGPRGPAVARENAAAISAKKAKAKKVADSWEDDEDSEDLCGELDTQREVLDDTGKDDGGLQLVVEAFRQLSAEFDEKFRKEWA